MFAQLRASPAHGGDSSAVASSVLSSSLPQPRQAGGSLAVHRAGVAGIVKASSLVFDLGAWAQMRSGGSHGHVTG
jgi:hypothetical protein